MNTDTEVTVEGFLRCLRDSELLSADELEAALAETPHDANASALPLAQELIRKQVLTRFQAERLLSGRTRGYFIEDYLLLDLLGLGGMGMVYLARKRGDDVLFALKTMNEPHGGDAGLLVRLDLEYEAGRRMDHRNVIRTVDRGVAGGLHYVSTKFFQGISLNELLVTTGRPPVSQCVELIRQAAAGLEHIHGHGVIHRDIKPENILVGKSGQVKVMDFGLSLVKGMDEAEFSLAMLFGQDKVGTADYVAPEQSIDSSKIDERADIYSLGCTLYTLLTGNYPYPVKSAREKLKSHRTKPPKPVAEYRDDVSDEVLAYLDRMIAKRPEDRPASAAQVQQDLAPLAEAGPLKFSFRNVLKKRRSIARAKASTSQHSMARRSSVPGLKDQTSSSMLNEPATDEMENFKPTPPSQPPAHLEQTKKPDTPALLSLVEVDSGAVHPIHREHETVGTSTLADVRLQGNGLFDRHCELRLANGMWQLVRLDPNAEMVVNGKSVRHAILHHDDTILLGTSTTLRVLEPLGNSTGFLSRLRSRKALWTIGVVVVVGIVTALVWSLR